jgi:hypothetical protein
MALKWGMSTLNYFKLRKLLGNFDFVMKMLLHCQHMDCLEFFQVEYSNLFLKQPYYK